jgi:hypothetical protein
MKIPVSPISVEFKEMECCALETAITSGFHNAWAKDFVSKARASGELKHNISILGETFAKTVGFVFFPEPVHRRFYFNLAASEKRRLGRLDGTAFHSCGHEISEHIKALNNVCFLMSGNMQRLN